MQTPLEADPPRMQTPLEADPPPGCRPRLMADPPRGRPSRGRHPPFKDTGDTARYGQQASGKHPNGMHSCLDVIFVAKFTTAMLYQFHDLHLLRSVPFSQNNMSL